MSPLLRFLELVCRELGADDARLEVGGRAPEGASPALVWAQLQEHWRVVALWDCELPPAERAAHGERLAALVASFAGTVAADALPTVRAVRQARHVLDDALDVLAQRARAERALVIDHASPEVWGSSEVPRTERTVDDAVWLARLHDELAAGGFDALASLAALDDAAVRARLVAQGADPAQVAHLARQLDRARGLDAAALAPGPLRVARALAAARGLEVGLVPPSDVHVLVRPFANIYRVVLVFDGPPSELHAEAALIRALPVIERMVLSLPPRDPMGSAGVGKVRVLRRLRRV